MLAKFINKILSATNLMIIRRSSFEKLTFQPPTVISDINKSLEEHLTQLRKEFIQNQTSVKWEIIDALERSSPIPTTRVCRLCSYSGGSNTFKEVDAHCAFNGGILHRYQCPNCDVIFGPEKIFQLTDLELTNEYERHYGVYSEGDSTEQELRAFHCLEPDRNGVFLNYGGGSWSRSVEILRNEGWNVYVFEPHSSASSGHDYVLTSKSQLSSMKFDGIYSNNVLEHLRDPVAELGYMTTLLKTHAKMSHATPCFEYLYDFTRFHLFFYLGRSRNYILQNAGLIEKEFIADGEFMCSLMEKRK